MRKAVSIPFFTFISFLFIASCVFAADSRLFGPKQYVRTSGPPNVFTDTFMGGPGVARLIVRNGSYTAGGKVKDGVTSATVTINGIQIFGPNDFKKKIHLGDHVTFPWGVGAFSCRDDTRRINEQHRQRDRCHRKWDPR